MTFLEEGTPGVVAYACHWVGIARYFPPAEMLGADCETEGIRGIGRAEGKVVGHLLGVMEFIGYLFAIDLDLLGVKRVSFVDLGHGFFVGGCHCS